MRSILFFNQDNVYHIIWIKFYFENTPCDKTSCDFVYLKNNYLEEKFLNLENIDMAV